MKTFIFAVGYVNIYVASLTNQEPNRWQPGRRTVPMPVLPPGKNLAALVVWPLWCLLREFELRIIFCWLASGGKDTTGTPPHQLFLVLFVGFNEKNRKTTRFFWGVVFWLFLFRII